MPAVASPLIARVAPDRFADLRIGDPINVCLASKKALVFDRDNRRLGLRPEGIAPRPAHMAQAG